MKGFRPFPALSVSLVSVIFLYCAARAYLLSITHDEALTYLLYVPLNIFDILSFNNIHEGCNHLLNTLLSKLCVNLMGPSEFTLRLPALLGFLFYVFACHRILRLFFDGWLFFLGLCLMLLHPFLVDYFSCSRGYALGLGFLMLGLYAFLKYRLSPRDDNRRGQLFCVFFLLNLAALSNLFFLYVFIAFAVLAVYEESRMILFVEAADLEVFPRAKKLFYVCFLPILLNVLFLALVYIGPVLKMVRRYGSVVGGGSVGFWQDTVGSLIAVTLYGQPYQNESIRNFILVTIVAVLGLGFFLLLVNALTEKHRTAQHQLLQTVLGLVIFSALGTVIQHAIGKTDFLMDRKAIFFIPLFFLLILLVWQSAGIFRQPVFRKTVKIFLGTVLFFFIGHSILCLNLTHFYLNRYDAETKTAMSDLRRYYLDNFSSARIVSLGTGDDLVPGILFYRQVRNWNWLEPSGKRQLERIHDFYYYRVKEEGFLVDKYHLQTIKCYPISQTCLAVMPADSPAFPHKRM